MIAVRGFLRLQGSPLTGSVFKIHNFFRILNILPLGEKVGLRSRVVQN